MHKSIPVVLSLSVAAILSGCITAIPMAVTAVQAASSVMGLKKAIDLNSDQEVFAERQRISSRFSSNPDTDAWHEGRQKIAAALGDRDFDQGFARVFDSLVLAMADLELKMGNIERQSGYLSASGMTLPPSEAKAMRREAVVEWCKLHGFDYAVLDRPLKTSEMQRMSDMVDLNGMMARYERTAKTLTFQLVKLGEGKTRVKLRFSDVYYPGEVETYYKLIWQAVDKQIFVDETVEGAVERRG